MPERVRLILIIMLLSLVFVSFDYVCHANAAEPSSIRIVVSRPAPELENSVKIGDSYVRADKITRAVENYYTFYSRHLEDVRDYMFRVTTRDDSFEIVIDKPAKRYNQIYTLNLANRTLIPGKSFSRSVLLISIRVILTLIIEGIIFWVFGFRKKDHWIAFLIINVITQGLLNIWINGFVPIQSYLVLNLIAAEILVFIAEIKAFLMLIKEQRLRTILYVLTANLMSLLAGGYIITVLPV